jgi:hypothetical protein
MKKEREEKIEIEIYRDEKKRVKGQGGAHLIEAGARSDGEASRRRRSDLGPRLTGRDMVAMAWLADQRAATVPQLQALLGYIGDGPVTDRRTRQIVSRWELLGLAERTTVWHGKPAAVWLTGSGARLVGLERWRKPAIGTLNHTLAVAEVRRRLSPPTGTRGWISEVELRKTLPAGQHIPDGAYLEDGRAAAIEVELSPHGRRRVAAAIASLLAAQVNGAPRWDHVLYLCSPETLHQVTAVVEALSPAQRSRVVVRRLP